MHRLRPEVLDMRAAKVSCDPLSTIDADIMLLGEQGSEYDLFVRILKRVPRQRRFLDILRQNPRRGPLRATLQEPAAFCRWSRDRAIDTSGADPSICSANFFN